MLFGSHECLILGNEYQGWKCFDRQLENLWSAVSVTIEAAATQSNHEAGSEDNQLATGGFQSELNGESSKEKG